MIPVRLAVAVGLVVGIFGRESAGVSTVAAAARNNHPNHLANDELLRQLGHDEPTPAPTEETVAIVDGKPRQIVLTDEPTGTLTPEPTAASDIVDQMIMEEFEAMGNPTPRPTEFRVVTDEPTGDNPWWQPTRKPTKRPTPRPTRRPTPRPTPAPVRPTPSPTRKIDAIMNTVKETLEPTSEPTFGDDVGGGIRDAGNDNVVEEGPIVLDRWVRVNLKSVPADLGIMNPLQIVAFEDVATVFLADLFQLTVPVVYDLALEVTGQKMLEGGRRRNRKLSSLRALQKDKKEKEEEAETEPEVEPAEEAAEEEEDLNTLQVDLRISGKFDPTDVHRAADDVNFDSMCRNFFTVNGGAVVSDLGALANQAMEEGTDGLDGSGLEYFATVQEIRGVTPPAGGFGGAADGDDPTLLNADDGGNSNQLAYIIAIAVGSVAFVGLVGTMFYIARRNKRNKRDARRNEDRSSSKSRSNSKANGSRSGPSKKYSPKKSKQSNAALSMMTDEERADALPPGAIDSPEEAQSEVGSLARFHTLEADDYQYSLEDGLGKSPRGKSPRSPGPLFKKRSNDNGMEYDGNGNTNGTSNLYSPKNDDHYDDHDDDDEDGFGDAADDATFSEFGKMLSSPGTFNVGNVLDSKSKRNGASFSGADEYRQKGSMMNLSPSTAGLGSPIPEEPEEKPKKKKKKKTFGASARRSNGASALNASGEWSADDSSATQENAQLERQKNSTRGDLSIDGSAAAHGNKDPLSPDADAWLYETITDVLDDGQSAKSGRSSKSGSPEKAFGKKKKSKKSRSKFSPMAVPEGDVAEDTTIPKPMEYTPGGDDKSVMTTVTKLEDAGMVRRECYAPPGKLGVVIDSTSKGPVVHEVKGGSPLEGIVFPGDRIIAIDGEDTRTLPASMVTKIMAAKKDQQRRMTLLSVVTGIEG